MPETQPYDPLDYRNLTVSLVRELMGRSAVSLPLSTRFRGPGVYALFYDGDFGPYATLRSSDATPPDLRGQGRAPRREEGGNGIG